MNRRVLALLTTAALMAAVSVSWAHGTLNWPAEFNNIEGTPCCTGERGPGMGDCVAVSDEIGTTLHMGSIVTLDFPNGRQTIRINAVHPTQDGRIVVCAPGCLFPRAGV